jgi:hypothetical protein
VSADQLATVKRRRLEIEQVARRADRARVMVFTFVLWELSSDDHRTQFRGVFELCSN